MRMLYCVRACARDASEVIWQYMAVNSQRSASVYMCVVFIAFNIYDPPLTTVPPFVHTQHGTRKLLKLTRARSLRMYIFIE